MKYGEKLEGKKGKLVKIGYGLYAKAKVSSLTGNIVPVEPLRS